MYLNITGFKLCHKMILQVQLMIVYVALLQDFFKCILWIMMTYGSLLRFTIISITSII